MIYTTMKSLAAGQMWPLKILSGNTVSGLQQQNTIYFIDKDNCPNHSANDNFSRLGKAYDLINKQLVFRGTSETGTLLFDFEGEKGSNTLTQ